MRFDVITLFPQMIAVPASESILGRGRDSGRIDIHIHDLRDFAEDKHRQCDDAPFGGGDGMVMKPGPLFRAVRAIKETAPAGPVIFLTPQGERFDHEAAVRLSSLPGLILVCGHYAGVDERFREKMVDLEVSFGDYVLSGGELPALVVIDAVSRLIPGVLGNEQSAEDDSFPSRLECPQYTRPAEFEGVTAPEVLLSGHHEKIRRWRKQKALERTIARRPDLLEKNPPDREEKEMLTRIKKGLVEAPADPEENGKT